MPRIICLFITVFALLVFESNSLYADQFDEALDWLMRNNEIEEESLKLNFDTQCRKVRKVITSSYTAEIIPSGAFKYICRYNWPEEVTFTKNIAIAACKVSRGCHEGLQEEIDFLNVLNQGVRTIRFHERIFKIKYVIGRPEEGFPRRKNQLAGQGGNSIMEDHTNQSRCFSPH